MKLLVIAILLVLAYNINCCTNVIISAGASVDGAPIIAYNADFEGNGGISILPKRTHIPAGTMRNLTTGYQIPEANQTYNVMGLMNEYQVAIGETTFDGLDILAHQDGGEVFYFDFMQISLQRCKTARCAIQLINDLCNEYGYSATGESVSIADKEEVWVMELIGKGNYEKGIVWVATKVPDGHVTSHANQAITLQFNQSSPDVLYSQDVISFARKIGIYNGTDEDFSFADVYDPLDPGSARSCLGRVWTFYNKVHKNMNQYLDLIRGINLNHRMPWSIKPDHLIDVNETMWHMRDQYDNTWFDGRNDVGATGARTPYRFGPDSWEYDGKTYVNERKVGVRYTGMHMASQVRKHLPDEVGGVIWWNVDDRSTAVGIPLYASGQTHPSSFTSGDVNNFWNLGNFTTDDHFWVNNLVANMVYYRWNDLYPVLTDKINELEEQFIKGIEKTDKKALELIKQGKNDEAIALMSKANVDLADGHVKTWFEFWKQLFTKYFDGQVPKSRLNTRNSKKGYKGRSTLDLEYDNWWYGKIVNDTGSHYLLNQPKEEIC